MSILVGYHLEAQQPTGPQPTGPQPAGIRADAGALAVPTSPTARNCWRISVLPQWSQVGDRPAVFSATLARTSSSALHWEHLYAYTGMTSAPVEVSSLIGR